MTVEIYNATEEDARIVAELMLKALGEYANFLMMTDNQEAILSRIQICFKSPEPNQMHQSNFIIAWLDGFVVGETSCYAGNKIALYNKNLSDIISDFHERDEKIDHVIELLEYLKEANKDEYYMDTISVDPEYRGQGIAQLLVQKVCERAIAEGFSKLALVVQEGKEHLLSYYKKLGFEFFEERNLGGTNYYRLIKKLDVQ
jgi:ribosomal protein S18 acetylase RimI-like enzyme